MQFDLLIQKLKKKDAAIQDSIKRYGYGAEFMLLPEDWEKYSKELDGIDFNWGHLKYSNFSEEPPVANNTPGIYLFVIKPQHDIFDTFSFIMYVGMSDEGLKERLRTGYRMPSAVKPRQNIMRLILDYGESLIWYYSPQIGKSKTELKKIETSLIGYLSDPPINKRDEPTEIADAKKSKMK